MYTQKTSIRQDSDDITGGMMCFCATKYAINKAGRHRVNQEEADVERECMYALSETLSGLVSVAGGWKSAEGGKTEYGCGGWQETRGRKKREILRSLNLRTMSKKQKATARLRSR